jgi:hypothetical protein
MSVLVAAAIITGGTSLCLTTVSYVGIKFAKWSAEREDAKEKAYREEQQKLIDDEKEKATAPEREKKLVEAERVKQERSEKRKRVVEQMTKDVGNLPHYEGNNETECCPFCHRSSGTLKYDEEKMKYDNSTGTMASGPSHWEYLVNSIVDSETDEGLSDFLVQRTRDKPRRVGPSSPVAITYKNVVYMWQICVTCGAQWRYDPTAQDKKKK